MVNIEVKILQFEELTEEAKETARDWYRSCDPHLDWSRESLDSIKTFCARFHVKLVDWTVGVYGYHYLRTDAENRHFRGLRVREFNREFTPTGYCLDCTLWETFYDVFKETTSAKKGFEAAMNKALATWLADREWRLSDESVDENILINEYEFYEDGGRV